MKNSAQKSVGQQLMLASRLYRARMAEHLAVIGIFPGQEVVLQALAETEGATMGELSRLLRVRPPTISKTVTRLASQGLVTRRSRADDARIVLVALTDEGTNRLERIASVTTQMEQEIEDILEGKDARRLRKLLRRLSKGLGKQTEGTDADADAEFASEEDEA